MSITLRRLTDNLRRIGDNIAAAAARAGRGPDQVRVVAVTKAAGLDDVKALIDAGHLDIGESRVQQLTDRARQIDEWLARRRRPATPPRWHMIGHLQRNKVKAALACAELIHSLDTLRLAEEIDARAAQRGAVARVLLEVNCSEEAQKSGVAVGAATHLAELVGTLKHVRLCGLMTMAPLTNHPEKARPAFVRLREIFEEIRRGGLAGEDFRHLSMGMTQDYTVAVEEGSTIVRIGTGVFQ